MNDEYFSECITSSVRENLLVLIERVNLNHFTVEQCQITLQCADLLSKMYAKAVADIKFYLADKHEHVTM